MKNKRKRWSKPHVKSKWCSCAERGHLCPNPKHWSWTVGNDWVLFPLKGYVSSEYPQCGWLQVVVEKATLERNLLALQALGWAAWSKRQDDAHEYKATVKALYRDMFYNEAL